MSHKIKKCLVLMLILTLLAALPAHAQGAEDGGSNNEELVDGEYVPDGFSFSGGSGKVTITCPGITVRDGQAYAMLVFSSPNYPRVQVDGVVYEGTHEGDTSVFQVPLELNRDTVVIGTTMAMSQPHDIEYTIRVSMGEDIAPEGAQSPSSAGSSEAASIPARDIPGLVWVRTMPLRFAHEFSVDYYEGGYKLLSIGDGRQYLVVPEGLSAPEGLDEGIRIIRQPVHGIYLAATSAMALFDALDALEAIKLSGTRTEGWYIDHARAAMEDGRILFAGKYSDPDYELLVGSGCDLAIESTMILHTPKVMEMIEQLDIPVFIEHSSYETHPLGRTEWVKLYGALLDRETEAEAFFDRQAEIVDALKDFPNTEKTVAFFYVGSDGNVVVRNSSDYISRMIEIAGGRYLFSDPGALDSDRASVSIAMEQFYMAARNADYLIYNASIDNPLQSISDLLAKSPLFGDFKAVQAGNVWSTDRYLYQATDIVGNLITDLNRMLTGETEGMTFIRRLS